MKKKFIYVGVLCLWATKSLAQLNVQLHYDLGHGMYGNEISSRQHLTATVENFSADKWGSTYFFMDADFGDNVLRGAYGEFSREIQTKKMPVAFPCGVQRWFELWNRKGRWLCFRGCLSDWRGLQLE